MKRKREEKGSVSQERCCGSGKAGNEETSPERSVESGQCARLGLQVVGVAGKVVVLDVGGASNPG